MLTLLADIQCGGPRRPDRADIVIAGDTIERIGPAGSFRSDLIDTVIPCGGFLAFPALIDMHVHIIGGGGEAGFASRLPQIGAEEICAAGVATLVGLLGSDGCSRGLLDLYAKAKALEAAGITTYLYSGSYAVPPVTFTGDIVKDLVLIDKVVGAGEIALSDHRSSHPSLSAMLRLASGVHLGGLLGGKAGILHLHMGDGKEGLGPLIATIEHSDLPMEMFVPTHVNRNHSLFQEAIDYCLAGGRIDLTAGETAGIPVPEAVGMLIASGADISRVTVSSDAGGSIPSGGTAPMRALYDDLIGCIRAGLAPETVFPLAAENAAKTLRLYPRRGTLAPGSAADILVTGPDYMIRMLIANGRLLYDARSR